MARKDVNLVFRAKDEAENVISSITKALNEFNDAQKGTASSSGKTETALGSLGTAINGLQKNLKGLSVGAKIQDELSKAESATTRLEAASKKTESELADLRKQIDQNKAALDQYVAKQQGAAQAQTQQQEAIKKTNASLKELKTQQAQTTLEAEKLNKRQAELPGLIEKQDAALVKTATRYNELSAKIAATEKPSKSLLTQFDSSARALDTQKSKLAGLKTEYEAVQAGITKTAETMGVLAQKSAETAAKLAAQTTSLDKIKANLAELTVQARSSAQAQKVLDAAGEKLEAQLGRESTQLLTAKTAMVELGKAAGLADDQMKSLSTAGFGLLGQQLTAQRRVMLEAKRDYVEIAAAAKAMAEEIGRAGVPTRAQAQAFELLQAKAGTAKDVLLVARETLHQMSQALQGTAQDLNSIEGTEARFVQLLEKQDAALQQSEKSLNENRAALERFYKAETDVAKVKIPKIEVPSASSISPFMAALRNLYGDTRKSLSITQRLRGEVLSLIASYGGLYGVVNLLGQVIGAYQKLEAAQARLNVANNGDVKKSADDLDFLRRNANRLGIDLGLLADEYSKFAISTQGTNLEGEKTKKIFLSVASAARVARLSNEDLSGVFVALSQIASKGAVQMEELRQQLGDRLPGALNIMAAGLGVTTGELIKMMQQGQVTSEALVPFAEELDKRFGPGLADAMTSTTVQIGRLKNAAFQALVAFGKGGFIDAFSQFAKELADLIQSSDFKAFIQTLSSGFANLIGVLGAVVSNFRLVVVAVSAFAGLKIAPVIIAAAVSFDRWTTAMAASRAEALALQASMAAVGVESAAAATSVGVFSRALAFLGTGTGIGLIITAVAAGIGFWATQADLATDALTAHQKILDQVKDGYDAAGGAVDKWRQSVQNLTVTEAKDNVLKLKAALDQITQDLIGTDINAGRTFVERTFGTRFLFGVSKEYENAVDDIVFAFVKGKKSADETRKALDKVNQEFDDGTGANHRFATALIEQVNKLVDASTAYEQAQQIVQALTGSMDDAQKALDGLNGKTSDTSTTTAKFDDAMAKLKQSVDDLAESSKKGKADINDLADGATTLEENYRQAVLEAEKLPDAIMRAAALQDALNAKAEGLSTILAANQAKIDAGFGGSLVDRIINVESGGNPGAANSASSAQGLGQFITSTWIALFKQHFPDRAAGMTDAAIAALRQDAELNRQMVELYLHDNAVQLQKAGVAITDANLYLSHFLGPGGAIALLTSAPGTQASSVLGADQVKANPTVLDGKTREEVIAWAQKKVGISNEELSIQESLIAGDKQRADDIQKGAEAAIKAAEDAQKATAETISENDQAIRQQQLINDGKGQQAAIEQAIYEAKKQNPAIDQKSLDLIAKQAAQTYQLAHAAEEAAKPKEAAQKAEEAMNQLLEERQALEDQLAQAVKDGDLSTQTKLHDQIASVNEQLLAAIDHAEEMWRAVGGQEADTAIAKLEAAKVSAQHFDEQAQQNYLDWSKVSGMIIDGLASAFDQFSQQVAEGVPVFQAARDAFLKFASDFLLQIAQMIIKQAIFNALQAAFGGTPFGALIGIGAAHTGGKIGQSRAGSGNQTRRVSPLAFVGAPRFHDGGIVGLRPGEVPIIAKQGERVLTEAEQKAMAKQGQATPASSDKGTTVINAWDSASILQAALDAPMGHKVLVNWLRENRSVLSNL